MIIPTGSSRRERTRNPHSCTTARTRTPRSAARTRCSSSRLTATTSHTSPASPSRDHYRTSGSPEPSAGRRTTVDASGPRAATALTQQQDSKPPTPCVIQFAKRGAAARSAHAYVDAPDARGWMADNRPGQRFWFGRYTSATPVPALSTNDRKRDQLRRRPRTPAYRRRGR